MPGVAWVFVGAAAVATLVALLVFLVPLGRRSSESLGGPRAGASGPGASAPGGPASSMARGFSFLHVSPHTSSRRPGVQERFARACTRVDAVDPHEAPRRIGEALLQAGLADVAAAPPPAPPAQTEAPTRTRESQHE